MIEGLKVTIRGFELRSLCATRADQHRERAAACTRGLRNLEAEGLRDGNNDPKNNIDKKRLRHEAEASEMDFIAAHLDLTELYILSRGDLLRLGIAQDYF